jgi:Putative zinc- or iron-chelating domain
MDFSNEFKSENESSDDSPKPLPLNDNTFPFIPQRSVLKEFFDEDGDKSGEIRLELGADGTWLQFDCNCLDALPYCQAQCCALLGTTVQPQELDNFDYPVDFSIEGNGYTATMQRDADGFCTCLNKYTRTCEIYENRPQTCKQFHCTRGADVRGFKLANHVNRQSI